MRNIIIYITLLLAFKCNAQILPMLMQGNTEVVTPVRYTDYVLIVGESTIDHRIPSDSIRPAYNIRYSNVKYFNGLHPDSFYTPLTDPIWGVTTGYSFDTYLMKFISDSLNITARFIKTARGATCLSFDSITAYNSLSNHPNGSFNVNVYGSWYSRLQGYINNVKTIERMRGNVARFRLMIIDIKGNDSWFGYTDDYFSVIDGVPQGRFLDFVKTVRQETGNRNLPVIQYQILTNLVVLGADRFLMKERQDSIMKYVPNMYMLRMDECQSCYPAPAELGNHHNDVGDYNKADSTWRIIKKYNLLGGWQ